MNQSALEFKGAENTTDLTLWLMMVALLLLIYVALLWYRKRHNGAKRLRFNALKTPNGAQAPFVANRYELSQSLSVIALEHNQRGTLYVLESHTGLLQLDLTQALQLTSQENSDE